MGALEEVRDLAEAVVRRRALRLWAGELGGQPGRTTVRVLVDADGGIDLETVAAVSEELSRGLDLRDPIPGRYTLEVSSPGLERPLRSPQHFAASVGSRAVVKTRARMRADSHRIDGVIASVEDSGVVLAVDDEEVRVPYDAIRSARTVFEWR